MTAPHVWTLLEQTERGHAVYVCVCGQTERGHAVYVCVCGASKTVAADGRLIFYTKGKRDCQYATGRRRVLADISEYIPLEDLLEKLNGEGWPYKIDADGYRRRDRALVAFLYVAALRVSEALRVKKNQLHMEEDKIRVTGILLSKLRHRERARKTKYREAWLPLTGERASLTQMIMVHAEPLAEDARLFPFGRVRAWQIISTLTGEWCHYFRALGEDYLYDRWEADLLAVADYVKVNPAVLIEYIRGRYRKHRPV